MQNRRKWILPTIKIMIYIEICTWFQEVSYVYKYYQLNKIRILLN